jgi:RNA polymerase sigma-B factor
LCLQPNRFEGGPVVAAESPSRTVQEPRTEKAAPTHREYDYVGLPHERTNDHWRDLASLHVRYVESRSPELCDFLIERYRPLARHVAGRYRVPDSDADDLDQVAMMGLLKALDRFDPARGVQFSTFAWATVNGEIKRYFRDTRWVARVPRRIQQLSLETVRAIDDLTARLMREPTIDEVAAETGFSRSDAARGIAAERARRVGSLSAVGHPSVDEPIELAACGDDVAEVEARCDLASLLALLPPRDGAILRLRFVDDLTQSQIAARVGMSQMHVSRILRQALRRLREAQDDLPRPAAG